MLGVDRCRGGKFFRFVLGFGFFSLFQLYDRKQRDDRDQSDGSLCAKEYVYYMVHGYVSVRTA